METIHSVNELPTFDFAAFVTAFDAARRAQNMGWYDFADQLWAQSSELNALRDDHPMCGGAISRLGARGEASCQYALFMLRWLDKAPEDFLTGPVVDVGNTDLPTADAGQRLRWDLYALYGAIDKQRGGRNLTWVALGREIGCTPQRLTNFKRARQADMALTMRTTQWLGLPAATFIHAVDW